MKTSGMDIRNRKKRGQWAELRFMAKATELGFQAAQPLGDAAPYDVVLDVGGRFISVQVKSTSYHRAGSKPGYFGANLLHSCGHTRAYERSDFDYLAVYYIPADIWYVIPSAETDGRRTMSACPGNKLNQWEPYREAWHLLQDRAPAPLSKRGHFDLYGIIEDYVPPPRVRR